jgi:small subunit ribosomal protein S15
MIKENPEWVPLSADEIVDHIVKMAQDDMSSAKIGLILRDQYGVPNVKMATGKGIAQIREENNVSASLPEDIGNLIVKAIGLSTHLKENPGDLHNKRSLHLIESKIRRLEKYYKNNGVLPKDWKYSIKTAELLLK